ncbi:MAG: dynamin family protein [Defluviitaleaceae bacterium]|nr:dynamin family protein [Defluviitaleaceae bacterium]
MTKVEITYNPYKLETAVKIDGKILTEDSEKGGKMAKRWTDGSRLQEWIEELPDFLQAEYGADGEFSLKFNGTLQDFDDVKDVIQNAQNVNIAIEEGKHTKVEIAEKEQKIKEAFDQIQRSKFEELKTPDITEAFKKALSSEIDICVVATMSAGKSTLINAILGEKLMPSAAEACTAIITRLKNATDEENKPFSAKVFDENDKEMESLPLLDLTAMQRLNSNEKISEIHAEGNIPIVSSKEMQLILIDTPGPTNARNPAHKKVFFDMMDKSSKPLLLFLMDPQYESEDNYRLLQSIAERMKSGGKQSKDRFIFAVNKLDSLDPDTDSPDRFLDRVRSYIETADIKNPSVFGIAAMPAMNIRLMTKGADIGKNAVRTTKYSIETLNDEDALHFEKYAPLPPSLRAEINDLLAQEQARDDSIQNEQTALVHTGITSIEAAIRQYVEKYAKTAKMTTLVNTFMGKLNGALDMEKIKNEIATNEKEREKYVKQIDGINKNLADGDQAKAFSTAIDKALQDAKNDTSRIVDRIVKRFENDLTKITDQYRGKELTINEADRVQIKLERTAMKIEPQFESELDTGVRQSLVKTGNELLEQYKERLKSLLKGLGKIEDISVNPLKLMGGAIDFDLDVDDIVSTRDVQVQKERQESYTVKTGKWYNPFSWGRTETRYRTVKYTTTEKEEFVKGEDIVVEFSVSVQSWLNKNRDDAAKYANEESQHIVKQFRQKFTDLDNVLKEKMKDLEAATKKENQTAEKVAAMQKNLDELQDIKNKVESILEI